MAALDNTVYGIKQYEAFLSLQSDALGTNDVSGTLYKLRVPEVNDIDFSDYRPLKTLFGPLEIVVPYDNLLGQSIDGFETETSLLATTELNGSRNAIFDGEGIWKWRAQSFIESKNYNEFDIFFGKVIQYLASNKRRSRLEVSYENFYYNNKSIHISAQYFDKNFVFNSNANLSILITDSDSKQSFEYPLLLNENYYEIDLSNLKAGEYVFKVSATTIVE